MSQCFEPVITDQHDYFLKGWTLLGLKTSFFLTQNVSFFIVMQMSTILQIICLVSHMLYYTNKFIANDIHSGKKSVYEDPPCFESSSRTVSGRICSWVLNCLWQQMAECSLFIFKKNR